MVLETEMWSKVDNSKNHVEYSYDKYRFVGDVQGVRATRMWTWRVQVRGKPLDGGTSSTLDEALLAAERMVKSYEAKRNDKRPVT
jgi:hypothetical protein